MGRLTIDPKGFIPLSIFGKEDLKLYAEDRDPGSQGLPGQNLNDSLVAYDDITERMPIMFGLHVPTFKVLDVLARGGGMVPQPVCQQPVQPAHRETTRSPTPVKPIRR